MHLKGINCEDVGGGTRTNHDDLLAVISLEDVVQQRGLTGPAAKEEGGFCESKLPLSAPRHK